MNKDFYEKAREVGHEYWAALKKQEDFKEMRGLEKSQETIRELEAQLEKFSEGSTMRSRIEEQIDHLKGHDKEIESITGRINVAGREILQLTAEFFEVDPKGEQKLDEEYIRALNYLLLGDSKDRMEFHECVISPEGVTTTEDEIRALVICASICDFVRMAARRKLGEDRELQELWEHISHAKTMFTVFSVLAKNGSVMTAKDISTKIEDPEWNIEKIRNNLNNLLRDHIFTHKLIMRVEKGKFKVSDIGRLLWLEFGPENEEVMKTQHSPQIALNQWIKQTLSR